MKNIYSYHTLNTATILERKKVVKLFLFSVAKSIYHQSVSLLFQKNAKCIYNWHAQTCAHIHIHRIQTIKSYKEILKEKITSTGFQEYLRNATVSLIS